MKVNTGVAWEESRDYRTLESPGWKGRRPGLPRVHDFMRRQKVPTKKNTDPHSPIPRLRGQEPHCENGAPIMLPRKTISQEGNRRQGLSREKAKVQMGQEVKRRNKESHRWTLDTWVGKGSTNLGIPFGCLVSFLSLKCARLSMKLLSYSHLMSLIHTNRCLGLRV